MIAGQVGIVGHLNIGDNVKIGAQSGIEHDIKDGEYSLAPLHLKQGKPGDYMFIGELSTNWQRRFTNWKNY